MRGNLEEGGFEEALLDDGDMDMLEIIRTLVRVGYDGALNPDHLPPLTRSDDTESENLLSLCYSVAYIKGLLAVSDSEG